MPMSMSCARIPIELSLAIGCVEAVVLKVSQNLHCCDSLIALAVLDSLMSPVFVDWCE